MLEKTFFTGKIIVFVEKKTVRILLQNCWILTKMTSACNATECVLVQPVLQFIRKKNAEAFRTSEPATISFLPLARYVCVTASRDRVPRNARSRAVRVLCVRAWVGTWSPQGSATSTPHCPSTKRENHSLSLSCTGYRLSTHSLHQSIQCAYSCLLDFSSPLDQTVYVCVGSLESKYRLQSTDLWDQLVRTAPVVADARSVILCRCMSYGSGRSSHVRLFVCALCLCVCRTA